MVDDRIGTFAKSSEQALSATIKFYAAIQTDFEDRSTENMAPGFK